MSEVEEVDKYQKTVLLINIILSCHQP